MFFIDLPTIKEYFFILANNNFLLLKYYDKAAIIFDKKCNNFFGIIENEWCMVIVYQQKMLNLSLLI